jgi:mono/diheme cytochrome c family protein
MRARTGILFFLALTVLLSTDPPAAQSPAADQMAQGAAVFQRACSSCHGDGGAGGRASALVDNRRLRALPRAEIETIIRNGLPNGMPPFGSLPDADALWVKVVSNGNGAGGPRGGGPAGGTSVQVSR